LAEKHFGARVNATIPATRSATNTVFEAGRRYLQPIRGKWVVRVTVPEELRDILGMRKLVETDLPSDTLSGSPAVFTRRSTKRRRFTRRARTRRI
jgi:hypothetical protein